MPRNDGVRALLSSRTFLRLWAIGGCVNTMRWFEVLAAALFTLDVTGSGLAVAVVSAARTLPMLLLGAFAGVMSEAVNRKRILLIGQIMSGLGSATIAVLAAFGVARPWHRRRRRAARRHRLVHRDVHPPAHGRRVRGRRTGSTRAGARHGHQFHHPPDRTDGSRHGLSGIGTGRRLRDIRLRLSGCGCPGRRSRLPANQPPDRAVACAARSRRGVRLCARPRDHRRCARRHHRDEPAGLLLFGTGRADRARRSSWCRRR